MKTSEISNQLGLFQYVTLFNALCKSKNIDSIPQEHNYMY